MTIIERLADQRQWLLFYQYKVNGGHMSRFEEQDLHAFILREEYLPIVENIKNHKDFAVPKITVLNKKNTGKKRIVYTFPREENYVLKLITYLLQEYDACMPPNLYSFRRDMGVKKAMRDLLAHRSIDEQHSYKVDIHDYFNSVDVDLLLPQLKEVLKEEEELYRFLEMILKNPYAEKDGALIQVKKGIMAGTPISAFLANLYLVELDRFFWENKIIYARYSDDIIVFAPSEEKRDEYQAYIEHTLAAYRLTVNPSKLKLTEPFEKWEYLGFSYYKGQVDISEIAVEKMKGKLKRKAKALYRWKKRKGKSDEQAIRAYIRCFNRKFFDNPVHNEITWCRWYFPIINKHTALQTIDHYMQACIRYLVTGKYTKANYNLRYETMCRLGYRSLVNEYYKQKNQVETGRNPKNTCES